MLKIEHNEPSSIQITQKKYHGQRGLLPPSGPEMPPPAALAVKRSRSPSVEKSLP
jgi:hypothetical protein